MDVDKYIENIGERKALKDWIDELPENMSAVVLTYKKAEDGVEYFDYKSVGDMTVCEANYLVDIYKIYLLSLRNKDRNES